MQSKLFEFTEVKADPKNGIHKGDEIECMECDHKHVWQGYEEGDKSGGKDKDGWFMEQGDIIKNENGEYITEYWALCKECQDSAELCALPMVIL